VETERKVFCDLLHSALKREEEDIRRISPGIAPAKHYLLSVAFATELVVAHLVRKQALRDRRAVRTEVRYVGSRQCADLCLVEGDGYSASLEIKGPRAVWEPTGPLTADVRKHLAGSTGIAGARPNAERYNAWILVTEPGATREALEAFILTALSGAVDHAEFIAADPIPINRIGETHYVDKANGRFGSLQVVVMRAVGV
jgi:hypothetical protein